MRENNHTHLIMRPVHSYKLTVTKKHFRGKKHLPGKKPTWWIKNKAWNKNQILAYMQFVLAKSQSMRCYKSDYFPCMSTLVTVNSGVLYLIMVGLMMVLLTFRLTWGENFMALWFEVGASNNEKPCLWWSVNVAFGDLTCTEEGWCWGNQSLMTGFMCLQDLFWRIGEGWLDFVTKLQKCTSFAYSWTTRSANTQDTVVPDQLLAANANDIACQMEEYEISDLVVILHCLNSC